MAKLDKVYSFNTGRHYDQRGQHIDWMIVKAPDNAPSAPFYIFYHVLFADRSRKISGIIPCMVGNIEDLIHDRWVQSQYDSYQYRDAYQVEDIIDEAIKNG